MISLRPATDGGKSIFFMEESIMPEEESSFIQSLKNAWVNVEDAPQGEPAYTGPPPSRSPFLSDLIIAYRKMKEGKGTPEQLKSEITSLSQRLQTALMAFNGLSSSPHADPEVKKIADQARDAFMEHQEAFAEMERFFADGDEEHLLGGIKTAEECTERLFEAYEQFGALQEEASKKTCLQCGKKNPSDVKYCQKCGMEFPLINPAMRPGTTAAEASKAGKDLLTGEVSIPTTFMGIYESIEKIKKGQITGDEFVAKVEEVMVMFQETRPRAANILTNSVMKIQVERDFKESVLETGKILTDGLDDVIAGMEELITYSTGKNPKSLYNGWNRMMNGGQQLLIAQSRFSEMYVSAGALAGAVAQTGEEQIAEMSREEISIRGDED
jgi:hypothetical protein